MSKAAKRYEPYRLMQKGTCPHCKAVVRVERWYAFGELGSSRCPECQALVLPYPYKPWKLLSTQPPQPVTPRKKQKMNSKAIRERLRDWWYGIPGGKWDEWSAEGEGQFLFDDDYAIWRLPDGTFQAVDPEGQPLKLRSGNIQAVIREPQPEVYSAVALVNWHREENGRPVPKPDWSEVANGTVSKDGGAYKYPEGYSILFRSSGLYVPIDQGGCPFKPCVSALLAQEFAFERFHRPLPELVPKPLFPTASSVTPIESGTIPESDRERLVALARKDPEAARRELGLPTIAEMEAQGNLVEPLRDPMGNILKSGVDGSILAWVSKPSQLVSGIRPDIVTDPDYDIEASNDVTHTPVGFGCQTVARDPVAEAAKAGVALAQSGTVGGTVKGFVDPDYAIAETSIVPLPAGARRWWGVWLTSGPPEKNEGGFVLYAEIPGAPYCVFDFEPTREALEYFDKKTGLPASARLFPLSPDAAPAAFATLPAPKAGSFEVRIGEFTREQLRTQVEAFIGRLEAIRAELVKWYGDVQVVETKGQADLAWKFCKLLAREFPAVIALLDGKLFDDAHPTAIISGTEVDLPPSGGAIKQAIAARLPAVVQYASRTPADWLKLEEQLAQAQADATKGAEWKAYVMKRLDEMGVPERIDDEHLAQGCRIGGRLDWVADRLRGLPQTTEQKAAELAAGLDAIAELHQQPGFERALEPAPNEPIQQVGREAYKGAVAWLDAYVEKVDALGVRTDRTKEARASLLAYLRRLCQTSPVSADDIRELRDICEGVVQYENSESADKMREIIARLAEWGTTPAAVTSSWPLVWNKINIVAPQGTRLAMYRCAPEGEPESPTIKIAVAAELGEWPEAANDPDRLICCGTIGPDCNTYTIYGTDEQAQAEAREDVLTVRVVNTPPLYKPSPALPSWFNHLRGMMDESVRAALKETPRPAIDVDPNRHCVMPTPTGEVMLIERPQYVNDEMWHNYLKAMGRNCGLVWGTLNPWAKVQWPRSIEEERTVYRWADGSTVFVWSGNECRTSPERDNRLVVYALQTPAGNIIQHPQKHVDGPWLFRRLSAAAKTLASLGYAT